MHNTIDVTVVIVNFNGGTMIVECLQALRRQTFTSFATIVVDNHSSDHSPERVAAEFPEVTLYRLETNTGFAAANNWALQHAPARKWTVLLNPDAFARPDWLACLLHAANGNPEFDNFGSRLCSDSAGMVIDGIGDTYHVSGLVWREAHGCHTAERHRLQREIFSPCAAAAMYRTRSLVDAGCFDEDLFCYVEDVDLGFRLRLGGHRSLYVPDAIVHHLGSGVVGVHSDFQIYHGHRNLVWVYIKNMPGILFWLFLPLHLSMNLVTAFWFIFHGKGAVILRAKRDALRGIPRFWTKRREIQARRKVSVWRILQQLSWNPLSRRESP